MFQLVLQFAPWSDRDFDDLVRLEEQLAALTESGDVDGHDLGSNEANIFVFTKNPTATLQAFLPAITEADLLWKRLRRNGDTSPAAQLLALYGNVHRDMSNLAIRHCSSVAVCSVPRPCVSSWFERPFRRSRCASIAERT